MEEVLGGLSGGACNSNEQNSGEITAGCGSSLMTAELKIGATTCASDVPNIEFGRLISFRQQGCGDEDGIFIDPHCCAICLQQFRSASVISAPGIRHAIAGRPSKTISSRTLASWRVVFTYQVVYAQFGTTATLSAVTAVTQFGSRTVNFAVPLQPII
jgi:hypothetical protein